MNDKELNKVAHDYSIISLESGDKAYNPTREIDFTNGALWGMKHFKRNDLFTKEDIVKLVKEYFNNAVFDETGFLKYIDDIIKQRDFAEEQ